MLQGMPTSNQNQMNKFEELYDIQSETSDANVVFNQELMKKVRVNDRIRIRENDQGTWTDV